MRKRSSVAVILCMGLTGCSYTYDLSAIVIHGRLAFVVAPQSKRAASCIRSIEVSAEGSAKAKPGVADDRQLVEHGVFWWKDTAVTECLNLFPVLYGQSLEGHPFLPPGVEAKPLKIGEIYTVTTSGSGSGYGGGRFRIRKDRTIENLPRDGKATMTEPANGS